MLRRSYYFLLWLALFFVCGCEQKELCYDHNHVSNMRIIFDWRNDTTASPSSMLVYLFPKNIEARTLKREFIGNMGGHCNAMVGITYSVLAFNSDTKNLLFSRNPSFYIMEAYLDDAVNVDGIGIPVDELPKVTGTEKQRIVKEADSIWSAVSEKDMFITQEQNERNEIYDFTLTPRKLYHTFKVKVLNIKNQNRISSFMVGTLSGLAGGVNLSTGKVNEEPVIIGFSMKITPQKSLEGSFRCFGKVLGLPNKLVIYTILQDGTKWCYKYDVTQQIQKAPDPMNVEVILDTLSIPQEIKGNSGITPGVSDWNTIYVPVSL